MVANFALIAASIVLSQGQPSKAQQAYSKVQNSLLTFSSGNTSGIGVLIDKSGLFLAHQSVIQAGNGPATTVLAKTKDGMFLRTRVVGTDPTTQLCVIEAIGWQGAGAQPVQIALNPEVGGSVIAVTPANYVMGDLTSLTRTGVVGPQQRFVPLSEIRMETATARVGGAMIFDLDGRLVGVLNAALSPYGSESNPNAGARNQESDAAAPLMAPNALQRGQYGPTGITVAYSLSPNVLDRVISGFKSRDRKVEHPSIGAFFKDDSQRRGVEITSVNRGSTAAVAGLQSGDIVVEFEHQRVDKAVVLASMLFKQVPGSVVQVKVLRNGNLETLKITVGTLNRELARIQVLNLPLDLSLSRVLVY